MLWRRCGYICRYAFLLQYTRTLVVLQAKGDIEIMRIFSLVAHDYKDRIFKLVRIYRYLHGSAGEYINFLVGVTSQQFVAFKIVSICVLHTHPSFFTLSHRIQFRSKFQGNAEVFFKVLNAEMYMVEMPSNYKNLTSYHCACARDCMLCKLCH